MPFEAGTGNLNFVLYLQQEPACSLTMHSIFPSIRWLFIYLALVLFSPLLSAQPEGYYDAADDSSPLAIASISVSINHSGSTRDVTCTMVLAGRMSRKNSPCTCATASQSSIRVSIIRVRMMSPGTAPSCSRTVREISKHRLAWAATSPATVLPSGPIGPVPPTAMMSPIQTAYPIRTAGFHRQGRLIASKDSSNQQL